MTYTEEERAERNLISTRKANKKWRENNKEQYKELQNLYAKKYYVENKEKRLEYAKMYRERKKANTLGKSL